VWNRVFARFHPILTILPDFNLILPISEFYERFSTFSLYWLVKSYDFTSWIAILTTLVGSTIFSLSYRSMFFTGCHFICDFSSNDHNLSFLLFLLSKKKINIAYKLFKKIIQFDELWDSYTTRDSHIISITREFHARDVNPNDL